MDEGIPTEEGERASHTQQDSEHIQGIETYLISSKKEERTALAGGGGGGRGEEARQA